MIFGSETPPTYEVFGWGKKSDDGWESLSFFIPHNEVPEGLQERFADLCTEARIGNTSICEPYHKNQKFFCIGWY
ncbi:hypothetical protein ACLI09_08610 [Flavobacterium sp. RHBU_24]|uniref:hypothetical protein n=1 Tax=Flavobacterium sp. RHBU_24 TaxID=3391185 RepID=UPI00398528EB